ncbi:hypothetical protein AAFC00_003021 [Neodothiora populina]|uniref:Tubulin nucleotide-binding domain-like protein n=1 Tax=Neodothiora populina TaxID=2781224 RepID=A0ABR3P911_9PEZI
MHEVVTLQFGQQANYVGTHFWNTQESYFTYGSDEESPVDHDIHFRPGIGANGSETYTPRTLIYDLKGAFGTLRRENALYELQDDPTEISQQMWSGSTNVIRNEAIPQSAYQQHLDQGLPTPALDTPNVRFWSDYNRVFYNPRSIVQLHEFELNSALMPFESWTTGEDLFNNLDREHDLLDRDLRRFLEECDQMQGIQIMTRTDDAWGGFTAKYLERIRDDLGKASTWVFGLEEGGRRSRAKQMLQTANSAQSIYNIAQQASLYIPITSTPSQLPSYVTIDGTSKWHTAALQVLAIESLTLPTRLRSNQAGRTSFGDIENVLSNDGNRRIAALSMSLEDPTVHDVATNSADGQNGSNGHSNGSVAEDGEPSVDKLDIDLYPEVAGSSDRSSASSKSHVFSQLQSLRGKWLSTFEIDDTNFASRNRFSNAPKMERYQTSLLFPMLDSYPRIFAFSRPAYEKIAVRAALSTSTVVSHRVRRIEGLARSLVGIDEREALCDGLISICEEYEDGWDSDSEIDDDA